MSNLLEFFGCLGGLLYVISTVIIVVEKVVKTSNKYYKYKNAYEELQFRDEMRELINPVGFKTEKERKELEAKASAKYRN